MKEGDNTSILGDSDKTSPNSNHRNYGIQLLRFVSMVYVIFLHSLGKGGVLSKLHPQTVMYHLFWYSELCAFPAVNIFGIISGYVGYSEVKKHHKYRNYIRLWQQIVCVNLFTNAVCLITRVPWLRYKRKITTFFPLFFGTSWYFRCYSGVFFMLPFLNNIPRRLSMQEFSITIALGFILFSVMEVMHPIFGMNGGYSFAWLCFLYVLGEYIHVSAINEMIPIFMIIPLLIFIPIVPLLCRSFLPQQSIIYNSNAFLISYVSPFVVIDAILYLALFSRMKIPHSIERFVDVLGSSAFTAYILDDPIKPGIFATIEPVPGYLTLCITILYSIQFVFVGVILDRMRLLFYHILISTIKKSHLRLLL